MDTKWKNIKYNKVTKAVALVLAILMFFLAGNFAGLFIKGFANFNIFAQPENFTNTASFRGQMNGYIIDALRVAEKNNRGTFEEWLQTENAKEISAGFDDDAKTQIFLILFLVRDKEIRSISLLSVKFFSQSAFNLLSLFLS